MDNKLTLNVDTIICAELKDETLSRDWVWGEETRKEWSWRKFKFVKTYVEGFYDSWDMIYDRIYYSKEQLEHKNNVIVDGKEVFTKANVTIEMLNGKKITRYFRNYSEALNFHNSVTKKIVNKIDI